MLFKFKIILIMFFIFGSIGQASSISDLAKSRQYIGGLDESDLKVQVILYTAPSRKKKPVNLDLQN